VIFICGGKWSTYRAMAEELIDRVIAEKGFAKTHKNLGPCVTKGIKLIGGDGYHELLYVQLVQKYGVSEAIAKHLCATYGAAAFAVCENKSPGKKTGKLGTLVAEGFPFIEAEIEYACKHEYAVTAKDMLTLRMRLAYLNSEAAKKAIPRVVQVMGDSLGWSASERKRQTALAEDYVGQFGGPIADKKNANLRARTYTDLMDAFQTVDATASGYIDEPELERAAAKLGFPFKTKNDLKAAFASIDKDGAGRITEHEFVEWWNKTSFDEFSKKLHKQMTLTAENEVAIDKLLLSEDARKK